MNKDTFTPHGYYTISNAGGYEIEIAESNDAARLKLTDGTITDWMEIEYPIDEMEPDYTVPTIDPEGYNIRLDAVMRI